MPKKTAPKKPVSDPTNAQRQKSLVARRKAMGLSRTEVWVVEEDKQAVRETAKALNKKRGIEL